MSVRGLLVGTLCTAWIAAIAIGLSALWSYASVPAPSSAVATTWPVRAGMARTTALPTLIVFAHPKCPCSRASLGELARVMTHVQGRVETIVAFYRPLTAGAGWERTDLWDSAESIPGVRVVSDPDGTAAQAFGVLASGHTLLYSADGRLLFSGGITAARGHAGDNAGSRSIVSLTLGMGPALARTSVFGCFLRAIDIAAPTNAPQD
jgi:hypothetical protein